MRFHQEILDSLTELGERILRNPDIICLNHPAINSDNKPCLPHDPEAVAWSMWDLLYIIGRKHRKSVSLPMFMEQMRCMLSNILEEDIITWQYRPNRAYTDILEVVSLLINLMSQRIGIY